MSFIYILGDNTARKSADDLRKLVQLAKHDVEVYFPADRNAIASVFAGVDKADIVVNFCDMNNVFFGYAIGKEKPIVWVTSNGARIRDNVSCRNGIADVFEYVMSQVGGFSA